jgi:hypothetical protein
VYSCLYHRDGDAYSATRATGSPWTDGVQHGGPPAGLLAHLASSALGDARDSYRPTRLTIDLFRPVPRDTLEGSATLVRRGRRLALTEATLHHAGGAVARASAVFMALQPTPNLAEEPGIGARPPGPEGLATVPLLPRELAGNVPFGFHFLAEFRWTEWLGRSAAWARLPMELIDERPTTAFERLATLADFTNAVSNFARRDQQAPAAFINVDTTLYLLREPVGEWFCLACESSIALEGVANNRVLVFDTEGMLGSVAQAALAQPRAPHQAASPGAT